MTTAIKAAQLEHGQVFRFLQPDSITKHCALVVAEASHDVAHGEWKAEVQHTGHMVRTFVRPTNGTAHLWPSHMALPIDRDAEITLVDV